MGARETALRVLTACRNNHAWADAALKAQLSRDGLVGPEAALCSRLVYGVVQNQLLLDRYHEFRTFVERKVANGFHITKDAGLFLAR